MNKIQRRGFLTQSALIAGGTLINSVFPLQGSGRSIPFRKTSVSGHLWQYASKFPPHHDTTPILDQIFADFKYAGIDGVELMDINLRIPGAVDRLRSLIDQYELPVTGTSFEAAMWDRNSHIQIEEAARLVISRLDELGGKNFGISVGYKPGIKTEAELDAQGEILTKILNICKAHAIRPNMHNHTYEIANQMHDLKGTLARVPALTLGPDVAHLYRGGVDPIEFIRNFGDKIVYLHLRDHKKDGQWTESVGEGVIDFPGICEALRTVNFRGDAAIELAFEGNPVREIRENWLLSRQYVKQVFNW